MMNSKPFVNSPTFCGKEGRPEGRELAHWELALSIRSTQARKKDDELSEEAEAVLEGDPHADFSALMTKDVPGG
jgi:hypothetical protein